MKFILPFLLLVFFCSSCTNDQLPAPSLSDCDAVVTYTTDIQAIVENSCAYEGCHISGFGSGDFSSFEGMQGSINSGSFEKRVVEQQDMPPTYAPEGKPKELTTEELELVKCWIENGYQE